MGVRFLNSGGGASIASGSGTVGRVPHFRTASSIGDTFLVATGRLIYGSTGPLVHIPTGQLVMGTNDTPDIGLTRSSADNWYVTNSGTTNLLQLGSSGILLGSNRDVWWNSTSDPAGTRDAALRRQGAGNIIVLDSGASQMAFLGSSGLWLGSTSLTTPRAVVRINPSGHTILGNVDGQAFIESNDNPGIQFQIAAAVRANITSNFLRLTQSLYLNLNDDIHLRSISEGIAAISDSGQVDLTRFILGANNTSGISLVKNGAASLDTRLGDGTGWAGLRCGYDPGAGVASSLTLTGANNITVARSTGVGTIKFDDTTSRDNVGFLKIYIGVTAVLIPCFDAD